MNPVFGMQMWLPIFQITCFFPTVIQDIRRKLEEEDKQQKWTSHFVLLWWILA